MKLNEYLFLYHGNHLIKKHSMVFELAHLNKFLKKKQLYFHEVVSQVGHIQAQLV